MNNDSTYELIHHDLEEASKAWAFAYAIVDMRGMMQHLHGDRSVLSSILSPMELERFDQYVLPKKKLQWLAGRLMVKTALQKHLSTNGQKLELCAIDVFNNENYAPYIPQYPEVHVSITHSFPYCIGVISGRRIGIDLEKIITPRKAMFDLFFHPNEIRSLPENPNTDHYKHETMTFWTRKEALSKLLGLGMKMGFQRMDTVSDQLVLEDFGNIRVGLETYHCGDFCCSIAVENIRI